MRALTERLKKGRLVLAVVGVVSAMTGMALVSTQAQAREEYRYDRDRHDRWEHDRWERERVARIEAERRHEWYVTHRYPGEVYYAPPAYYAPPTYYTTPSVGFGFTFH